MDELKPCPFCGTKAKVGAVYLRVKGNEEFRFTCVILCSDCQMGFSEETIIHIDNGRPVVKRDGYQKIKDMWNRRDGQ